MAEKRDPQNTIDIEELMISELVHSEALINLLVQKGIITREELFEEIKRVDAEIAKAES
ncbi:MAG: hypothetical protein JXD19_06125 [Deltaproteobacteria bacterium]|nr:hypothetical protein [Deltaproteobacteria bacterium]